jgi:phage tail tape-measure protein
MARASAGIAKPTGISTASATMATRREKDGSPNTVHLKNACPARNRAVPPRVSAMEAGVPR